MKTIFIVILCLLPGCLSLGISDKMENAIRMQEKYTERYVDETLPLLDKEKDRELIGIGERLKRNAQKLTGWAEGK